jgi:hypothetical protein
VVDVDFGAGNRKVWKSEAKKGTNASFLHNTAMNRMLLTTASGCRLGGGELGQF